jgi:hypothetical protein
LITIYAPEVKRCVKLVEDTYSTNGNRTDHEQDELEAFQPGG